MSKFKLVKILTLLEATYPEVKSELHHESHFQLLVGTILSAQATDRKVNEITQELFTEYQTPNDFLSLSQEELEQKIKQIHYYRTKAKHILATSRMLVVEFDGEVPIDREALMRLPGVGRKTANVIRSYAFNLPAIAVDTHVFRVANRLGIVHEKDVLKTELEMERLIPKKWWSIAHSSMVLHGRRICEARNPNCGQCSLTSYCNFKENIK